MNLFAHDYLAPSHHHDHQCVCFTSLVFSIDNILSKADSNISKRSGGLIQCIGLGLVTVNRDRAYEKKGGVGVDQWQRKWCLSGKWHLWRLNY